MKKFLIVSMVLFTTQLNAMVDSMQCPSEFTIDLLNNSKAELSPSIENDFFLKLAWEKFQPTKKVSQKFTILTRSGTLCVYVGGSKAVYIQTNNFQDEIVIPYDNEQSTFLRLSIASFSTKHVDLESTDTFAILAPIFIIGADSITQVGEDKIGESQEVIIHVKP